MGGQVTVTPTRDLEFVTMVMRSCFLDLADDDTPADQCADPEQIHLIVSAADTLGVVSVHPMYGNAWQMHLAFVPSMRRYVRAGLLEVMQWVRANTPAKSLVGLTEAGKHRIAAVVRVVGGERVGRLRGAFKRGMGTDLDIWQVVL